MKMTQPANTALLDLSNILIEKVRRLGGDAADVVVLDQSSLSASCRLGKREDIDRAESVDISLRVFAGRRQAFVSSSDIKEPALNAMAERAVAMAKAAPEDPYACLAPVDRLWRADDGAELDLYDPTEYSADALAELARAAEDAALAVPGVTNSEGGGAGWSRRFFGLVTSDGFCAGRMGSSFSVSASVLAGDASGMERDYDYSSTRHAADLEDAALIGRRAGERAVRRLHPRKIATGAMPLVFDPRVAGSLLGHFAGAINGAGIARGTSFLRGKMDQRVFAPGVRIIDDPLRPRGLSSRPFDGEGVTCTPLNLVDDGILRSWLLDSATAAQLKLQTTGHAGRSGAGAPSPTPSNLYMAAGTVSPQDLIGAIGRGFYVTELIGAGVNGVTGDYSRGASGFLIENGALAGPVSEVTIAGNLAEMFQHLTPADDLEFRHGINAPTLRIDGMMVAGS